MDNKLEIYRRYNRSEKGLARKRRYYQRLKERFPNAHNLSSDLPGYMFVEAFRQGEYKVVDWHNGSRQV